MVALAIERALSLVGSVERSIFLRVSKFTRLFYRYMDIHIMQ
jgi:hypothetical protein